MAGRLVPAEGLCQDPERERDGDEEQAETYWAAPAEPRTPGAPVFQAVLVAPAILLPGVFDGFVLCHV